LCKVLFATETFAMGVNMPTRSVVFEDLKKFDGKTRRELNNSEYTQMAGRAGRRGIDKFGMVIINCNRGEIPDEMCLSNLLKGKPTRLTSRFRLTYNMILNLLRCTDLKVEHMVKRSFGEFATEKIRAQKTLVADKMEKRLTRIEDSMNQMVSLEEVEEYYWKMHDITELEKVIISAAITASSKCLKPGRIVAVRLQHRIEKSIGVIVGLERSVGGRVPTTVKVLVLCNERWSASSKKAENKIKMCGNLQYFVESLGAEEISSIYKEKISGDFIKITRGNQQAISEALMQLRNMQGDLEDMPEETIKNIFSKKSSPMVAEADMDLRNKRVQLREFPCHKDPGMSGLYTNICKKNMLKSRMELIKHDLSDANCWLISDFTSRCLCLRSLRYIDEDNVVQLKGRVAIEINNIDAIVCSELIFENVFKDMAPEDIAAVMSVFVFQGKHEAVELPEILVEPIAKVREVATRILDLQLYCGVDIDTSEDNTANVNEGLANVVREWALGKTFTEITELTEVQEGIIVRTIARLFESLRDIGKACRVIGDYALFQKVEASCEMIKRDIVFAASLYISPD